MIGSTLAGSDFLGGGEVAVKRDVLERVIPEVRSRWREDYLYVSM